MALRRKTPLKRSPRIKGYSPQEYNGRRYHSKMEANFAASLDLLKRIGEIQEIEPQFCVEMVAHDSRGVPKITMKHHIDFRVTENDGSYSLLEVKGFITEDYAMRRKWLEKLWLPDHPDHSYRVLSKGDHYRGVGV